MPTSFYIPSIFLVADNRIIRLHIIMVFEGVAKDLPTNTESPFYRLTKDGSPFAPKARIRRDIS